MSFLFTVKARSQSPEQSKGISWLAKPAVERKFSLEEIGMEYELVGRNLVIRLPEELDHHSCQTLRQDTEQCLENYDIARIVLDFSAVSFMDSTGIGVILGRYKRMRELGGDVALYGAGRRIRKLIRMSGIEKLARVCETEADALKR